MTSARIRQAERGDLDAIVELDETTFDAMAFPRFFVRQACDAFGELLLVAEDDGAVIAYGLGVAQAEREDGWILGMAVAPDQRGQGIGARILVQLLAVFQRLGVARVLLTVEPGNAPARRLYDEHGFVEVDEEPEYFGPGEPRVVMARNI
jgi:ribosomal-protein-alanine N-acetyltransferase